MSAIDWRTVCMDTLLADGVIDAREVGILKKALKKKEGGGIHPEGMTFLVELRAAATKKAKAKKQQLTDVFEDYFAKSVVEHLIKDGEITAYEADWLRKTLFLDKKIDDREWKLLQTLNKKATKKAPEFEKLYADCEAIRNKAKK